MPAKPSGEIKTKIIHYYTIPEHSLDNATEEEFEALNESVKHLVITIDTELEKRLGEECNTGITVITNKGTNLGCITDTGIRADLQNEP